MPAHPDNAIAFRLPTEAADELLESLAHIGAVAGLLCLVRSGEDFAMLPDATVTRAAFLIDAEIERIRHLLDEP